MNITKDNYNASVISEIMPLPVDEEKTVMPSVEEATRRGRKPKADTEKLPSKGK